MIEFCRLSGMMISERRCCYHTVIILGDFTTFILIYQAFCDKLDVYRKEVL